MFKYLITFKYLRHQPVNLIAFLAVGLCVFIASIVMAIMVGLTADFKEKTHRTFSDCIVSSESLVGFGYYGQFVEKLSEEDCVKAVASVINNYALVTNENSSDSIAVEVVGIEPNSFCQVTGFADTLYFRKLTPQLAFEPLYRRNDEQVEGQNGCVVGIDLWLNPLPDGTYKHYKRPRNVALSVSCFPMSPKGALVKAGTDLVNTKDFYFCDTSYSGLGKVDGRTVYLPFEQTQTLCGMNLGIERVSAIYIKFKKGAKLEASSDKIRTLWGEFVSRKKIENAKYAYLLDNVTVKSWKKYRASSIAAIEKEQMMMGMLFGFVAVVTVFIVFVVFYMLIAKKSKDIGIMKSLGMATGDILAIFLMEAWFIGASAATCGIAAAIMFLRKANVIEQWLFETFGFQIWDRSLYSIGKLSTTMPIELVIIIAIGAVTACMLGAIVPARKAAKTEPAKILQVNQL